MSPTQLSPSCASKTLCSSSHIISEPKRPRPWKRVFGECFLNVVRKPEDPLKHLKPWLLHPVSTYNPSHTSKLFQIQHPKLQNLPGKELQILQQWPLWVWGAKPSANYSSRRRSLAKWGFHIDTNGSMTSEKHHLSRVEYSSGPPICLWQTWTYLRLRVQCQCSFIIFIISQNHWGFYYRLFDAIGHISCSVNLG